MIAEAKRKAIKIIFMLTNGLGRLDEGRQGQYYRSRSLYEYIASETGGEVRALFFLTKQESVC